MLRYPYYREKIEDLTVEGLTKFIRDFKANKLDPLLRSEPVPEPQTVDGLTTIVGTTYNSIVKDVNKDVLVLYHADFAGPRN